MTWVAARRGPFAGLPREAAILSAVSFTVALGYGIAAPAIPAFARQFGVGIAVVAVSSLLAGFSRSFAQLLVLRGVGGLGSAMFSVSAQALLLASVPSGQRGRASGLCPRGPPSARGKA